MNEDPPAFSSATYTASVAEDEDANVVVTYVTATDPDVGSDGMSIML